MHFEHYRYKTMHYW